MKQECKANKKARTQKRKKLPYRFLRPKIGHFLVQGKVSRKAESGAQYHNSQHFVDRIA
jgi:hypothetical protein